MLSEDGNELEGRFFRGAYNETGFDVKLTRLGTDPRIAGISPRALPAASGATTVRFLGANFPVAIQPDGIDFGPGVDVKAVTSRRPTVVEVQVEVASQALPGRRNVFVSGATAVDAFAIYEKVDYVKVRPEEALARLGGVRIPKQFAQFEAVAFHRGPDDEPLTDDDIELGPVEASWSLEEYHFRHDDDDVQYVGSIDQDGLFTPAVEGPNPERETNNWGDVWVVASYSPPERSSSLKGRARLVVTCELLTIWESFPP
jgi:quinohemoprotein amine dehydrogenase